ncbi:helix-turn-helix transcriptional regulator [Streptomyces sp. NBC_00557]|uniref:helix-turn-helix transcriptional regulator n=1 Tax=Streptomyces sp. NBC_00557 TaxID=2975776 RepID=UPI002E8164B6|nr:AAA family ATPase [Streptomyces sp. NBC_00557]
MTEAERTSVAGALQTVLTTCAVGRSRAVLIEGPAGCGKSHLLDAVSERAAAAGALVLTAAATEQERRVPLGVLRQLVCSGPAFALARTGADDAVPSEEAMRAFRTELCGLALDGPVVLCLDDVQHTDPQSLHCLRHLVRHLRPAPVLVVATVAAYADPAQEPLFTPELLRLPYVRRIRLGLLTPQETAQAAATPPLRWPAPGRPGRTPGELHSVTGGNPLLLRALLQEDGVSAAVPPGGPTPDGPFADAVLACVHRSGPGGRAVARAVATLAGHATEPLVDRMLDLLGTDRPPRSRGTGGAPDALRACGVLDGLRFRHPSVAAAVLAETSPRVRVDLHRMAARALSAAGAPAGVVADHLLAPQSDGVRVPVGPEDFTLLVRTAEALLAPRPSLAHPTRATHPAEALPAPRSTRRPTGLPQIAILAIPRTTLRNEALPDAPRTPQTTAHIPCPADFPPADAPFVRAVAGRPRTAEVPDVSHAAEDAERLLVLAHHVCPDEAERAGVALRFAQLAARRHPEAAEQRLTALVTGPRSARPAGWDPSAPAAMLLAQGRVPEAAALLHRTGGPGAEGRAPGSPLEALLDIRSADCETLLRTVPLTDAAFAPLVNAVRALLCSDRPERAVVASGRLLAQAERSGAPGWRAVCADLHAEALLRVGDASGAREHATAAFDALPTTGGGTFHYGPAAVLVQACVALGRHDEAARHVRYPVTRQALTSLYGLRYLRARGLHQLSLGQPHLALADFRKAGRVLQSWRADRPALLAWRTDAAQALLRTGRLGRARALAEEQLALPDATHPWVRGISLRLLAATGAPGRRTALLRESVELLRRSGDRLETARSLADLGHALHADDRPSQGAATVRAAWNLAQQMGAVGLREELVPGSGRPAAVLTTGDVPLTDAERRVAALAAEGLTNRGVAARLGVTVSTVEQHLTRVYRKLGVSGRAELPARPASAAPVHG